MRTSPKIAGILMACLALSIGLKVLADDEDALAKAPAPVQTAAKAIVGANKLAGFDEEKADGKNVYEVSFETKSGGDYSVTLNATGEVLSREVEVDSAIVPPNVLAAAQAAHADGKITESSIVTEAGIMFYEFDLKVGNDLHEVQVNAAAKVTADTITPPEAPNAGEKDEADEKSEKKN